MLPNGLELERREVRGEVSDGMILAEDEVGLGGDHAGIMLLPETEPGTPLADVLPLVDDVLLVEATGNRPDLQSVYGLAREIATLYDLPLADMSGGQSPGHVPSGQVRDPDRGLRRLPALRRPAVRGRRRSAPSPQWLRARLFLAGQRPISNVVDVTNYVMLALGNPLHAFDFTTLARRADRRPPRGAGREADDARRRRRASSSPDDLVIADADRADRARRDHGRRGDRDRRGRRRPSCSRRRTSSRTAIYRTSERQRLRTEGSNRWEKGVDPYLAGPAADLATRLLLELAGGALDGASDVHGRAARARR